jgi:hypothetical protein
MVVPPFFATVISSIFFAILLAELQSAEAAALKAASRQERKAQGQGGCDRRFHCYVEKYNLCLHKMSNECVSQRPDPEDFITSAVTPPPTPMPVTQSVQLIFETESPLLLRLMNVEEDYTLSASDRTRYVDMIQGQLDDATNDSWEIISVEQTCEYVGDRRLQSSQRGRGGGGIRRLNKTLYLPVLVTLRGEEDYLSGMAGTLTLQAIRNKLSTLSMNLKSLNPNAFQNLQISVEELNLADVACATGTIASIQTIVTSTNVDNADPLWVWMIVAAICVPLGFCLLICTCRNCTFKSRKHVTMDDYPIQKQLAIHYGHANAYDNGVSFDKRDMYRPRRQRDLMYRRSLSEGARRHGRSSRRRRVDERRRYSTNSMKRRDYRKTSNKRSLSMVEHEILALEERNILDERALVALPAHQSAFAIDDIRQVSLPTLEYQENALVVYDDENIRFPLEPEGDKIEDVKPETALVPYR